MSVDTIIQSLTTIIMLASVILIYKTIISNKDLNQKILFANITREERELRIKLQEYVQKIENKKTIKKEKGTLTFAYDTLLFNYYEFLAICLHKGLVNESETKLYFKDPLVSVKKVFESSTLFKEGFAQKEEYKGLQWLFKKWNIQ